MTQEEFLRYLHYTADIIRVSHSQKAEMGIGNFLMYFDKYKDEVFSDFSQEIRDSSLFQDVIWELMNALRFIMRPKTKDLIDITDKVVNLNDYRASKQALSI